MPDLVVVEETTLVQVETKESLPEIKAVYVSNGLPLGPQIDALFDLREEKRAAEAEVDRIAALMKIQETTILLELEAAGLKRSTGLKASVGIEESVVPQVVDWTTFYAFIRRNNAFELLERRPATGAFREYAERRREKTVPGVVPFTKRKLSLRVDK